MVVGNWELNSATSFQGFLNSADNLFSATSRFEPIFLRKSRFFSALPSAIKKVACLASFMKAICGAA
jgi:hypothetical protein